MQLHANCTGPSARKERGPQDDSFSYPFHLSSHSNSAVMKNSRDDVSYSTRRTFGLQQTWQSST